jgi:DUF1009 family protein
MSRTEPSHPSQTGDAGRIAVIAGSGVLPVAIIRTLTAKGADPFVVAVEGEFDPEVSLDEVEHVVMPVEAFGTLLPLLAEAGIGRLVMAGGVARRPKLRSIRWRLSTLSLLPRVAAALVKGDDGLLRALIKVFESRGIRVVAPQDIVPDLLAPAGPVTKTRPVSGDRRDVAAASEAAIAIGRLDIGQAAVSIGGRVVALEGIEGTEGLLERVVGLRDHGRLAGKRRGVLVKRCKPRQEERADLPAIGPDTVTAAHAAGLAGIGVDAGRSFILDFERTVTLADELGLFIVGLDGNGGNA